jgi:hypothetical protein
MSSGWRPDAGSSCWHWLRARRLQHLSPGLGRPHRRDRPSCSAGRVARVAWFRVWPRCASGCLAGQSLLHLGTRFQRACHGPLPGVL